MAKKRKARKDKVKSVNMLKPLEPIDIMALGTDDDPCFGKHFDMTEDECKRCGDCNLCQIVTNQKTIKLRGKVESENRFKDLELDDAKALELVKKLRKKDTDDKTIIKKLMRRFGFDDKKAKALITQKKKK